MKLRSPISLALVKAGYVRGTKEFKNAYNRELQRKRRLDPAERKKDREKWQKYYQKKQKETDGDWNRSRIKGWRQDNPGDWKIIADRATKNGVHKRFYANHKEQLKKEKAEYGRQKRRQQAGFGLRQEIADARKSGDFGKLIKKLKSEIDKLD